MEEQKVLLRAEDLKKYFKITLGHFGNETGIVKAVDDVSLDIYEGETLGIVGESGCGKTTIGRLMLRLTEATEGKVYFEGEDIFAYNAKQVREMRKKIQVVFQDPYASLDPKMTIGKSIQEAFKVCGIKDKKVLKEKTEEILSQVGLYKEFANRYPSQLSGGQRQRVGIARALALQPKLIICDEPVSALDVSVQSQVINLLKDLQNQYKLTYAFIAHDLSVVKHISDRVAVMYLGKLMELSDSDEIFENPLHPYTRALLSAIPIPDPKVKRERIILTGDVPNPIDPPKGCRFSTRCMNCMDICKEKEPELIEYEKYHFVNYNLYNK